ncbi:hypothetical protein GCM10027155_07290 [Acinetobacter apis]
MGTDFEHTTVNPVSNPQAVGDAVIVSTTNVGALTVNGQSVVGTACLAELTINNNLVVLVIRNYLRRHTWKRW